MKMSGHLDLCGPSLIEGWLYADDWGREKLSLQVYVGADLIGECTADRFRADLRDAGFGDGRCGFSFVVPPPYAGLDFAQTRLRLLETPMFLLPNEFTRILTEADEVSGPNHTAGGEEFPQGHSAGAGDDTIAAVVSMVGAARKDPARHRGGSFFKSMNA